MFYNEFYNMLLEMCFKGLFSDDIGKILSAPITIRSIEFKAV